jgi:DNA mismatch repair protein MutS
MTIVEEYLELTKKYKNEYGEKTLVLMQVGSFFEAYGLIDKDNNIYGSDIVKFAELNDMAISKKNICVEKQGVVMSGFGLPQLEKYIKKMQENGYTIPVYTQDSAQKNTTRNLSCIFSPGTYFSNESRELSNNITCVWLYSSYNIITKIQNVSVGISNIDIFTGKTCVFEFTKPYYHNPSTYDELERFISIYNPNECIIISNLPKNEVDDIISYTQIVSNKIHKINMNNTESAFYKQLQNSEKQVYQKEILTKFYKTINIETLFNSIQHYGISIQSFVFLLEFTYKHNPNLVNKISEPLIENYGDHLILANHSLKQLNIISDSKTKYASVCGLLNNCVTPMGKRDFNYILLNPITNIEKLNESYTITEHLLNTDWIVYRNNLNNFKDIEKIKRKLIMKKITPKDFCLLNDNIKSILILYDICQKDKVLINYFEKYFNTNTNTNTITFEGFRDIALKLTAIIENTFNMSIAKDIDELSSDKLNNLLIENLMYLNITIDVKIAQSYKSSLDSENKLTAITCYLSDLIKKYEKNVKATEFVKIHETPKSDSTLQATKRRTEILKKIINEIASKTEKVILKYHSRFSNCEEEFEFSVNDINYLSTSGNQTNMIITNQQIRSICSEINTNKGKLISNLEIYYDTFINNFINNNIDTIDIIILFITQIDVLQCKCYIAKTFNYNKPEIIEKNKSFVKFEGLRHPLIEHINTKEIYIANSLDFSTTTNGILLYGTNAVGKTSFIKSVGIAIIMAQSGLYVPANKFFYYPYNSIFTRILGNDNIFKGLSTFAVEMIELRTILQLSNESSLILGDELCSGTESDSALSIFVAGLEELHKKNCTFLFATHFHEIVNYEEIKSLYKMKLYHMTVLYDKTRNILVYDRILKEGPGDSMYGLEVCKSLNLSDEFLTRAHSLRIKYNKMHKSVLQQTASKYNSEKLKGGNCEICKSKIASEIHHLEYKKDAVNDFIINKNTFAINHPANLINICEDCHNDIHKNNTKLMKKKITNGYDLF